MDYNYQAIPPPLVLPDSLVNFAQVNNDLKVYQDMLILGAVNFSGTEVYVGSTVDSTSASTGALVVAGGAGVIKSLFIGSSTVSTSSTNGGLVVAGGVGAGNLVVATSVNAPSLIATVGTVSTLVSSAVQSSGPVYVTAGGSGFGTSESGSGPKLGTFTMTGVGSATVANTSVSATSRIFITNNAWDRTGGVSGLTVPTVAVVSRATGARFIVQSSDLVDTSTYAYEIFDAI